tara:strand:+ start:77 stop:469 length:393 start_codon:yes stop_codon:yes gene_type:complete
MNVDVPVSYGELVDKLTILQIKLNKIKDKNKLANIKFEHEQLSNLSQQLIKINKKKFDDFYERLISVNLSLWSIEDEIRILEKEKNFGDKFIQLARDVYFTNDKRFKIKSEINTFFGSSVVEEKEYIEYQ